MSSAAIRAPSIDPHQPGWGGGAEPVRRPWVPRLVSLLCLLTGLLDLVSALTRAERARIHELSMLVPGALTTASNALTLVTGILLVLLARGLRRRKRRAWQITVGLLLGSVALHLLKGLDVEEATVALLLLAGMVVLRKEFYAEGDPRTRWRALGVGVSLFVTSYVLGLAFIGIRDEALVRPFSVTVASQEVLEGLVGIDGPLEYTNNRRGRATDRLVSDALLALGALTFLSTAYLVLRPAEPVARLSADDEARMRALLARHGARDSLGYFALRRDKSVIWSPDRQGLHRLPRRVRGDAGQRRPAG